MPTIPVLMYHHISPLKGDTITVTPEVFEAHMRLLKDQGFFTPSLHELMDFIEGKAGFKGKAAVITFDDGYLDNYIYGFPVLKSLGIKAVVFLVTGWADMASLQGLDKFGLIDAYRAVPVPHNRTKELIERADAAKVVMDWAMIEEMRASGFVEFGSHTMTHRECDKLKEDELDKELRGSKSAIEARLKTECKYLSWPRGKYNAACLRAAKEAGYSAVFTTEPGVCKPGDDPFSIKRIVVKDDVDWFRKRLRIYTSTVLSSLYLKVKGRI
ncbi:MAG: polysaccharide deacetylase family protein [Deltaproteobacteria bacterium]